MNKDNIQHIVSQVLSEQDAFLVDLSISGNNKISVWADSYEGMTIQRLKMINRYIEQGLDRDLEDFDLTISSPGLDQPFKVIEQYKLNIDRLLKIQTGEDDSIEGRLKEVLPEHIIIETRAVKKIPSKIVEVRFEEIKEAKIIIEFKKRVDGKSGHN